MAIINGTVLSGFNVGTDLNVGISDNFGDAFPVDALGHMMDFDSTAATSTIKVVPITRGGKPLFQTVWNGGHGRITFSRVNGNLQSMMLQLMQAYHDSGIIPVFEITASVLNRDGSIDEYQYSGVQWETPHFGNFRALKEVDMGLDFMWSDCTLTGAASPFLTGLANAA